MTLVSEMIDLATPSDNTVGVPLNSKIKVIFSQAIDEWSLSNGAFILEGPDTDQVIYPGYRPTNLNTPDGDVLQSPELKGPIPGKFTFNRIDLSTLNNVDTVDTTGNGNLYRTQLVFEPNIPLKPLTNYRIYLIGQDDSEEYDATSLKTKTVFDTITSSNSGNGQVTFSGTYLGEFPNDKLNIKITSSGVAGIAEFEAWTDNTPIDLMGPFLSSLTEVSIVDGISVQFKEGTFEVDDEFSVVLKRPVRFEGTVMYSFITGNGSITALPASSSSSILGEPISLSTSQFKLVTSKPDNGDTNLKLLSTKELMLEFSSAVDPSTINSETIKVFSEPVIDHPGLNNKTEPGYLNTQFTVSGNKVFIKL